MENDAWFFVGIFVFIFLIWVATGGPARPLSFAGPTLAQPEELGGGNYLSLPRAPFGIGSSNVLLPGSTGGPPLGGSYTTTGNNGFTYDPSGGYVTNNNGSINLVPPPLYGIPFGTPSPHMNQISLSNYVSNASTTDEYVTFSVDYNSSESINITKWTLESEATGNAEIIPKGTATPASGVVNATDDILLDPGDRAIVHTGRSPVGASFRENKCTGYFNSTQHFSPALPNNCPSPQDELKRYYGTPYIHDPSCIDYVDTLQGCRIPVREPSNLTLSCQSFIENTFNYNGCVAVHKNDADFRGNTWDIYLDRVDKHDVTKPMWRTKHEIVKLLDERGKTVAVFSY